MVKIFGNHPLVPTGQVTKTQRPQQVKKTDATAPTDKVAFSSVLSELQKGNEATEAAKAERATKINEIKQQIADGTYAPDLHKVSASLLRFLVEGNDKG